MTFVEIFESTSLYFINFNGDVTIMKPPMEGEWLHNSFQTINILIQIGQLLFFLSRSHMSSTSSGSPSGYVLIQLGLILKFDKGLYYNILLPRNKSMRELYRSYPPTHPIESILVTDVSTFMELETIWIQWARCGKQCRQEGWEQLWPFPISIDGGIGQCLTQHSWS